MREVLVRATKLEEEAKKTIINVPKIIFRYDEEIKDISRLGRVIYCQKSVQPLAKIQKSAAACRSL